MSKHSDKKKRKRLENGKFLLVKNVQILHQNTILHQQKRKKPNAVDIINRHRHLPRLPAIQVPMSNRIMRCLKLSLKIKNLDRNYPKVWSITQTNILKSKFQRIVWKRLYYAKTRSRIIFKEVRWLFKGHLERKT